MPQTSKSAVYSVEQVNVGKTSQENRGYFYQYFIRKYPTPLYKQICFPINKRNFVQSSYL